MIDLSKNFVISQEKQKLKDISNNIRTVKKFLKETQRNVSYINSGDSRQRVIWGSLKPWEFEKELRSLRFEYRHLHIAYCLFRGRKYEEIENKTSNPPDMGYVSKFVSEMKYKTDKLKIVNDKISSSCENKEGLSEVKKYLEGKTNQKQINCFYWGINRSHCSSCYESSDEELWALYTNYDFSLLKREFKKFIKENPLYLTESIKVSNMCPDFLESISDKISCRYQHTNGESWPYLFDSYDVVKGDIIGTSYNLRDFFIPEKMFSKEKYSFLLEKGKKLKELKDLEVQEEKRKKEEVAKIEKEYREKEEKYKEYLELKNRVDTFTSIPVVEKPEVPKVLKFQVFYENFKKEFKKEKVVL